MHCQPEEAIDHRSDDRAELEMHNGGPIEVKFTSASNQCRTGAVCMGSLTELHTVGSG